MASAATRIIVITGGGTGGHVYPGLAVADRLRDLPGIRVVWVGSASGLESRLVRRHGLPFYSVPAGKLRRYLSLKNLADVFRILAGFFAALRIYRRLRPSFVFSKGGYVSVPPVAAARFAGIPVATHESDLAPGLATRLNTPFADRIFVPYEETARAILRSVTGRASARGLGRLIFGRRSPVSDRVVVSGNPVRSDLASAGASAGRRHFGVPDSMHLLLVMGGSQGAAQLNSALAEIAADLPENLAVVHQTGPGKPVAVTRAHYHVVEYLGPEYPHVLAAADLVVSRAGAGALWELARVGVPSILVPLVDGSRGDQIGNAELFARAGAAVVLDHRDFSPGRLLQEVRALVRDTELRQEMSRRVRSLAPGDAAGTIADYIMSRLRA